MSVKTILISVLSVIFISSSIPGYSQEAKVPAEKENFHVFILMGESNMANSGTPVLFEYMKPNPNVLLLGNNLRWSTSVVNYGAGMGPGQVFARYYAELHPGVTVGLVQCAKAGRLLKDLSKGTANPDGSSNYDGIMEKIKTGSNCGTLKAILWHQGESDSGDSAYVDKLKALVKDIRTDIGQPDLPFIVGELGRFGANSKKFNELLSGSKKAIPSCSVVSSEGLMDLGDIVNFSGFSVEVLGSRYLMEYLKMKEPALVADFKQTLDDTTKKMLAKDTVWITILNPSMTEGESRPMGWDGKWVSKGILEVVRDSKIFNTGPASLRLESTNGPVTGSIFQTLRNVAGKKIKISCKVMNAGFTGFALSLIGMDSASKQVLQKNLINARDATEWTSYTVEVDVPPSSTNTRLLINISGEGRAWVDDFSIEKEIQITDTVTDTVKEVQKEGTVLAANSTMSEKYDKPLEWNGIWTSQGSLKVAKDLKVFKSPPSSLRIDSDNGFVDGSVSQELKGVSGKKVRVKGWVKYKGFKKCSAGIGAYDSSWKLLKWGSIFYKDGVDELDWTYFDKVIDVPAGADKINLPLGITGEGSAWFDDIEIGIEKDAPK